MLPFKSSWSLESWIAFRYLRTKKRDGLLSFITVISIVGIALGIIALIVVLSVMNGFQRDVRAKLYDVTPHLEIGFYQTEKNTNWQNLAVLAKQNQHVISTSPFIKNQILLAYDGTVKGTQVLGVYPELQQAIINQKTLNLDALTHLKAGEFGIVLGQGVVDSLGLNIGDKVTVLTPEANSSPVGMIPRLKQFKLVGTVYSDIYEVNQTLAYMHIKDAEILFRTEGAVSGLAIRLDNPNDAPEMAVNFLPAKYQNEVWIQDWSTTNRTYFEAVSLEKKIMFIIMALISTVACFNLISSLVMTVNEKRSNIAILRTLGLPPYSIMKIFIIQGSFIGFLGTLIGLSLGLLLALNLSNIFLFYEYLIGQPVLESQIYFLNYIPVDVQFSDIFYITFISLFLSFTATLYPSYRAAKTQPAEALRYE